MLLLGDAFDARGFALAGARTIRCRTRADVVGALRRETDEPAAAPQFVVVSRSVYELAAAEIDELRDRRGGPIVVVLPETVASP